MSKLKNNKQMPVFPANRYFLLALIVALVGLIIYSNTVEHKYVLDDYPTIKENKLTKQGLKGVPAIFKHSYWYGNDGKDDWLYRPLSVAMFAVEWEFWPDQPKAGHVINVLLYALTGYFLFFTLRKLFADKGVLFPFAISLLFIAHPLHSEVVANIKSRDEILTFLFFLLSLNTLIDYARSNNKFKLIIAICSFFLALMAKESAITFLFMFPLALFYYSPMSWKKIGWTMLWLSLMAGLYMFIRGKILSTQTLGTVVSIVDNTVVKSDWNHRLGTAFVILGMYLKLLVFPHPLVYDYSYHAIEIVGLSDIYAIISIGLYLGLMVFIIKQGLKKEDKVFGIILYLLPVLLVSNLFFLTRSTAAERFLYHPTLGFAIVFILLLGKWTKTNFAKDNFNTVFGIWKNNKSFTVIIVLIVSLFGIKTYIRAADWKDNITLFGTDVKVVPNSARAQYSYANDITQMLVKDSIKTKTEEEKAFQVAYDGLNKALSIHENYFEPYFSLGQLLAFKKEYTQSLNYYRKALHLNKDDHFLYNNMGNNFFRINQLDSAMKYLQIAIQFQNDYAEAYSNIGSVYFTLGKREEAIKAYNKAISCDSKYYDAYKNLGSTYGIMKEYPKAMEYFNTALKLKNTDPDLYTFISITYNFLGDSSNAKIFAAKANELRGLHNR